MPYKEPDKNAAAKTRWRLSARGQAYARDYYEQNRARIRETTARYKSKNKARYAELARKRYAADLEASRARERARSKRKDPQKALARCHRRRARVLGAPGGGVSAQDWSALKEMHCGLCAYCLKPTARLEREHVQPVVNGGEDAPENMVAACRSCNAKKQARELLEWLMVGGEAGIAKRAA